MFRSILLSSVLAGAAAVAANASAAQPSDDSWMTGLLMAAVVVPFALVVVRRVVLWRLGQLMMKVSSVDGGAPAAWSNPNEVSSVHPLTVQELDAAYVPPEARAVRERWVASAVARFRQLFVADAGVAAAYLVLPVLSGAITGHVRYAFGAVAFYVVLALLMAGVRYGAYRNQFRASETVREGLVGGVAYAVRNGHLRGRLEDGLPRPLWRRAVGWVTWPFRLIVNLILDRYAMLAHEVYQLLSPRVRVIISGLFMLYVLVNAQDHLNSGYDFSRAVGLGLIAAVIVHAVVLVVVWRHHRRQSGARLLVLRVFNIDENASFTFGGVLGFWKHFGNYFTVVDASVWRHDLRLMTRPGLVLMVGLVLAVVMAQELFTGLLGLEPASKVAVAGAVLALGSVLGTWWAVRWLDKDCIRSLEHLQQGLKRLEYKPRGIDLSCKPMRVICHDNTWRVAVDEFARGADAVLMDLRGLSASNQGCASEVDFLFDHVPLHKLVFIVDAGTDQALVRALLLERWQMLSVNSPNLPVAEPSVQMYVAALQDPLDIQCILDLLMLAAQQSTASESAVQQRPGSLAAAA